MTRIIRGQSQPRRGPAGPIEPRRTRVVRSSQQQTLLDAESTLAEARRRAADLVEQARAEAEALRQAAIEQGQAAVTRLLVTAERQRRRHLDASERELTELAIGIARKLLDRELRLHPEVVAEVVGQTLRAARGNQRVLLRVNPADLAHVEAAAAHLQQRADVGTLSLDADPSVAPGGCVVETDAGQIDGQIDRQLAAIRAALLDDADGGSGEQDGQP